MSRISDIKQRSVRLGAGLFAGAFLSGAAMAQPDVGPQVRADPKGGVEASNETSIATTNIDPDEVVAVWNDWRESDFSEVIRMGVGVSLDGGKTWDDFLVRPPAPNRSSVEGDPMTAYDHRTGTLWVGAISFASNGGLYVAKKVPGSTQFEPSVQIGQRSFADKCWMAAGPAPGNPNSTNVYIAYNEGVWRSTDMGQTWQGPVSVPNGLGFLPRVGPDGTVYVTYWDIGVGHNLIRSFDGGKTFGSPIRIATRMDVWNTQDGSRFPGLFRVPSLASLAVDMTDGTLYAVYPDTTNNASNGRNVDLYFASSADDGATWTTPVVISLDQNDPPGDQFFPWIEVDDNGVIHMVYYDSQNTVQNDNTANGMFDAYYAYSDDRGANWQAYRLTPNSFNSINDGLDRGSSQFLGDYLGLAYGGNKVYPCYLSTQNGDSDIFVNSITTGGGPAIRLSDPTPGVPGQNNTLSASGAEPGDQVVFIYGFQNGSTNVKGCPGLTVDIQKPKILGRQVADSNGDAQLTFFVPNNAAGRTIRFQAGQTTVCEKSNLVAFTF